MDRGDYRLLPKGLRRLLVFSETFFFREYGKAKTPKKTRRGEVLKTSSSLAFCEWRPVGPAFALSSFGSASHFWNANRTSEDLAVPQDLRC
jgi:hypothetical protein